MRLRLQMLAALDDLEPVPATGTSPQTTALVGIAEIDRRRQQPYLPSSSPA